MNNKSSTLSCDYIWTYVMLPTLDSTTTVVKYEPSYYIAYGLLLGYLIF